jgi:hypothetical protein
MIWRRLFKGTRMSSRVPEELKDLIIVHPHGLPCLADKEGNLYLCCLPKTRIGSWNKETDEFKLELPEDINDAVALWRTKQIPRARTERITEYSGFPKKMPVPKQPRATRSKAAKAVASK